MGNELEPRICTALNVAVDEEWELDRHPSLTFRVELDGSIKSRVTNYKEWAPALLGTCELVRIINHPELIHHKTIWTEEDTKDARMVLTLRPDAEVVTRSLSGQSLTLRVHGGYTFSIAVDMFPSVKSGSSAFLDEIIGSEVRDAKA